MDDTFEQLADDISDAIDVAAGVSGANASFEAVRLARAVFSDRRRFILSRCRQIGLAERVEDWF